MHTFGWLSFFERVGAGFGTIGPETDAGRSRVSRLPWAALLLACAALVSCSGSWPAAAAEALAVWQATAVTGAVQMRAEPSQPWRPLAEGESVGAGSEIQTGADGHAVLTHQTTTMTAAPNSAFALPQTEGSGLAYRIIQSVGTVI
ncbi:MAG: hypothetical protein WCF16_02280, partial [Alphaproteobacteria bacterium]